MLNAVRGVIRDSRNPLGRRAASPVREALEKAASRANTEDLVFLARLCTWTRGKLDPAVVVPSAQADTDIDRGTCEATAAAVAVMHESVQVHVGASVNDPITTKVKLRRVDTTRRDGHVEFDTASRWVQCERGEDVCLVTVINDHQDAATELTVGALLLTCQFLASARNAYREDTTAYSLSVAAWDPEAAMLHTMSVCLRDAVDALQMGYSGVLRGVHLADDERVDGVGLCAV
jgi:hypothetical protein